MRPIVFVVISLAVMFAAIGAGSRTNPAADAASLPGGLGDPPIDHITIPVFHRTLEQPRAAGVSPAAGGNLQYHGGITERTTSANFAIYWVPSPTCLQPNFMSPQYQLLINRYFTDVGGNSIYNNNVQYYDTTGNVLSSSSLGGSTIDLHCLPVSGCPTYSGLTVCLSNDQVLSEVQSMMNANGWTRGGTKIYYLFLPKNVGSCFDSAGANCAFVQYCAYHSSLWTTITAAPRP